MIQWYNNTGRSHSAEWAGFPKLWNLKYILSRYFSLICILNAGLLIPTKYIYSVILIISPRQIIWQLKEINTQSVYQLVHVTCEPVLTLSGYSNIKAINKTCWFKTVMMALHIFANYKYVCYVDTCIRAVSYIKKREVSASDRMPIYFCVFTFSVWNRAQCSLYEMWKYYINYPKESCFCRGELNSVKTSVMQNFWNLKGLSFCWKTYNDLYF